MFEADAVEISVLAEHWVDMLLPDVGSHSSGASIERNGLIEHFDARRRRPQAEFGLSLLVRVHQSRHTYTALFDAGLTGDVIRHNLDALELDVSKLDHIVISHGHPDHFGGVYEVLEAIDRPIPVGTHPDAFLPRYAVMPDGRTAQFYNAAFSGERIERSGGRVVLTREPLELGCGLVTTGEIPRKVEFEGPRPPESPRAPGLYQVSNDGQFRLDEVWDEQGLVINLRGQGIIVLTGCAHAGVVNTIMRAKELVGDVPVKAVMGGFHLGFPTTPQENVARTVEAFKELSVEMAMPMHCSGLRTHAAFLSESPAVYVQPAVGTTLRFGSA